jgi:hypothetical protein
MQLLGNGCLQAYDVAGRDPKVREQQLTDVSILCKAMLDASGNNSPDGVPSNIFGFPRNLVFATGANAEDATTHLKWIRGCSAPPNPQEIPADKENYRPDGFEIGEGITSFFLDSTPHHNIKLRKTGTYNNEQRFSVLVGRCGYKPDVRTAMGTLRTTDIICNMKFSQDRSFVVPDARRTSYDHNRDSAEAGKVLEPFGHWHGLKSNSRDGYEGARNIKKIASLSLEPARMPRDIHKQARFARPDSA